MRSSLEDEGVLLALSDQSFIRLTRDKLSTLRVFRDQGIRTPKTWTPDESERADWPDSCFIKPRYGSASTNARCLPSAHAEITLNRIDTPLIQERVEAPEITVDALFDLDEGRLLHYVPRRRLQTKAGESVQGQTIKNSDLQSWLVEVLRVAGARGARGPLTLQAFLTDPEPTLSEINPRFGGGFPLSRAAGAHYPEWLVRMRAGEDIPPKLGAYEGGLCMARYYDELFFSAPPAS
jgi:carbamoyl-phosphate synthase large subunit